METLSDTRLLRPGRDLPWRVFFRRLVDACLDDRIDDVAASLTFYAVVALFPLLIVVFHVSSRIVSWTAIDEAVHTLARALPIEVTQVVLDRIAVLRARPGGLSRVLVGWIEPVLARADKMFVVTDTSVPSVRHCRRLIEFFVADNVALPVEVIVNHETRSLSGGSIRRATEKVLERKLEHWLPHDRKAARAAVDRGKPLSEISASGSLARAFTRLAAATRASLPAAVHTFAK